LDLLLGNLFLPMVGSNEGDGNFKQFAAPQYQKKMSE
jgi:hypothetical protein